MDECLDSNGRHTVSVSDIIGWDEREVDGANKGNLLGCLVVGKRDGWSVGGKVGWVVVGSIGWEVGWQPIQVTSQTLHWRWVSPLSGWTN